MASNFLENLKSAVEKGEFNSDAAKKINEIDKLADEKNGDTPALDKIYEDIDSGKIAVAKVDEEDVELLKSEYEEKMARIDRIDGANAVHADLLNKEDLVLGTIADMIKLAEDVKKEYSAEFEAKDPEFMHLLETINHVNMEFNSIFNNLNK